MVVQKSTGMRKAGMSSAGVVLGMLLIVLEVCDGGITSSYVRNDDLSLDMPLDSDVFRVPPGYNAPQQVCFVRNHAFKF